MSSRDINKWVEERKRLMRQTAEEDEEDRKSTSTTTSKSASTGGATAGAGTSEAARWAEERRRKLQQGSTASPSYKDTTSEWDELAYIKAAIANSPQAKRQAAAQTYLDTARNATQKTAKNSRYVADTADMESRLDELRRRNKEITPYVAAAQKTGAENMKSYLDEFTENNRLIRQLESDIEAAKAGETISHVDDLKLQLEQAKREEALAKTESDKYMGYSRSMPVDPEIASASIAKTKAASEKVKAIEQELERIDYINKQSGKTYEDTFSGQFGANKTLGRLGQDVSAAYNEYLTTGDEEDKAYANALALLTEQYRVENKLALDDEGTVLPWVSKSLAGYLPQFWDQTKAQLGGAAVGALGGLAVGNPLMGAKIGATAATGIQSYGQMRGAAYQELINAGVDEETARAAASDEAVLSALIEMGDTALELATFGTGKLLKALGKGGVKAVAGEAAESGVKKLIKALGKYGLDVGQEMLEEGTQQAVSIANRNRSLEGNTGLWNLTKSTALTTKDAVSGKDAEARAEIWDAAKEGGKIAAMMGGVNRVADLTTEAALRGTVNAIDRKQAASIGNQYQAAATKTIEEGLSFPEGTEAHTVAQEVMEKLSRDGSVSDYDLGRVVVATERTMRQQEAQAQPAVSDEETLQLARETVAAQQNAPQAAPQTESVDTKAVPLNVMSMETPEVKAKLARKANTAKYTGYGDAGVKAFDEVVEKSGQTREAVRTVFQSAYETGLAGVELEHVKDSIVSDVQMSAYLAGREDYVAGLGRKASTNVSGKAGFDTKGLPKDVADWEVKAIDTMARELGVSVSMTDDDGYNGRITGSGVLLSTSFQREFDGKEVGLLFHGAHEIGVHRVLQLAPKEGRAFVNAMYRYLVKDAPATDATLAEKKRAQYGAHDVELSTADAMEELAANAVIRLYGDDPKAYADAVERVLSGKDEQAKKGLAKFKEVLGEIVQKIRRAISKLTGRELQEAQRDLSEIEKLRDLLETAMKAAQAQAKAAQAEQKNTAQTDGGTRLSINESYSEQMLAWDGKSKRVFTLGTTSEALRSIGIRDSKIVLYSGKATDILNNPDHDMDQKTLAKLPDVLENPIAILKSQQVTEQNKKINDGNTSRLVIFGTVEDTKGVPVSVVLELMPTKGGKVLELSVVASAYGKTTHLSGFVQSSEVLYLDENKKRTNGWLQSVGVQFPSDAISYGSMGRVTYIDGKVKIQGTPFSKISGSTYISAPKQAAPMENWQKQLLEYRSKLNEQGEKSQFSLKEPVEEKKNLIALHNLTADKLLKALNLGGFPMPSIAVTKSDIPHTNFGDITLVMSKSTIDPKASRKNTVYSADAWTPTFPQVEYDVNPASEYALYDMVRRAGERLPDGYRSRVQMMASSIESYLNNTGTVEGVIERFKDEYAIKALYLTDKGETVERKTQEVHHEKQTNETFDAVLQLFDEDIDTLSKTPLNELHQKYAEDIKQVLVENGRTEKQAELAVAKNGGLVGGFAKYISRILRYAQEPAYTTETVEDTDAMEQDIDSRIDAKEYVKWLRDMFQGLILDSGIYNGKDIYTASGNRRSFKQTHYPLTLENVAKAMAAQNGGNSKHVTGFVGIKSLRAGAAVRFKSIAHMHELEGRLKHLTQEEADAVNDALSKRLSEITERIYSKKQHSKYDNVFIEYDTIGNILMEVTEQDKYTVDTIQKVFSQYQYTIGNQLAADIRDLLFDVSEMPVNIFEAKPERAVRFDEVLAAVIPNTSSDKLREGLKNAGVKVLEYAQDDNAARLELVNSVEDAKFSLKDDGKLERENARLKEVNQNLRDQFKRTKFAKVDKKSLDIFTKKLLKDYKSGADINDVREALDAVYTYMGNGDRDGQPPVWDDLMQKAYVVAQNILTNVVELDTEMYDEYKSLRDYLRTTGISISRDYEHDLGPYENLAEFRRANMGRIKIVNDGLPIDRAFQELAASYPGFFDEYDTTNPADQLLRLEEVLDSLQPVERNPYTHDMRNHATWLANDILERFFELPQAKPTYADKAAKKLADTKYAERRKTVELREAKDARIRELIEEKRKEVREAALGERMASGREIAKLKRAYEEKEAKASETRRSSGLRGRIERHAAEMSQKLLKPDDKHHVPQELRAPVAALLDAINLESQYTIDPETGKRVKNGGGDPVKRSQAFADLRDAYQEIIKEDSADIVVDPAITEMLDRVKKLREVKLAEMSYSELETIWQVLRVVEHTVNNAGKLLSQEKYERTTEWAEAFEDDTETRRSKRGSKLEGLRLDLENPYTFFDHYGEAGHAVYRMLRDAQDKQQLMTGNVAEAVEKIVDPKTVRKLEKEVHEFKTERGVKLVLTKAHIMDIYLLTKRQQAQEHLLQGGIAQPEVKSRRIERSTDAVLLSYNDLQAIVGKMTEEDRKIAIRLQELTKTTLANYGNAASLKAYGYKKFTGEDYWPIKSAKEGVHSNVEKGAGNTRSIKNIGLAKTVMPHANNPLDIGGIFKTFATHSADMIDYAAWLCPMEDANRLFNFQFRDEAGMRTGKTIKGLLDRYGGKGAQEYWHRLMEDIQNGIKLQSDTNIMKTVDKVIGNVRGASVGANLRVIIQQPTAILRAAAVLSPADMAAGLVGGGGWKAALRHSAIAQRKDMGGFDISSPAQMQEILFDSKTKLARFNEAMMWGAGKADAVTWGRIWSACEAAVKRKNKNLKPKSEEFYEAVDALFTEVIDQTQVVDGVLQRSQAMRSKNATLNQATAFMGEPTMAMNMLLRAYDGLVGEQDSKKRSAALRKFGRTAMVLLVTNGVNALAQSIIDAARDDEDEEYWDKFWASFTGLTGEEETAWEKAVAVVLGGNMGSSVNPATYVPFAKDFISILLGYDVARADADAMKDIVDAFVMYIDSKFGNKKRTVAYAVKNLAQQVGKVFGISAPNILRDVWGIARTIAQETGNIPLQYEMEKAIYNIEGEGNVSRFVDILYKAYTEDQAAYRHIYADLKSGGFDMSKIKKAMEERMKKAQGVTKVDDLDQRYLTPEQQTAYDKKVKAISKSDLWKSAKTAQRDELKDSLYDLTVMNGDGEKLKEKINEGRGYGIDETEYLLYSMALDMADTPNKNGKLGGTPTNAEKADAISMVGGLSDSEIAFLWDTEQGYEAYAAGIDMKAYIDVLGEGGSVNVEKLVDAKANDISEESYFDFLDMLDAYDTPNKNGKLGTITQAEATAAIAAMPGLTDAQRAYLWQSVDKRWKENKNPWR